MIAPEVFKGLYTETLGDSICGLGGLAVYLGSQNKSANLFLVNQFYG